MLNVCTRAARLDRCTLGSVRHGGAQVLAAEQDVEPKEVCPPAARSSHATSRGRHPRSFRARARVHARTTTRTSSTHTLVRAALIPACLAMPPPQQQLHAKSWPRSLPALRGSSPAASGAGLGASHAWDRGLLSLQPAARLPVLRYNPDQWVGLMKRAGITFFDFTTKHHEGFSMYASRTVQFHRSGGQFVFGWPSARMPHGAYVWCLTA